MNRNQLIENAITHINNLLFLIQAEKLERGEWDKKNPWVKRTPDGKFGSGGGSSSIDSKSIKEIHSTVDKMEGILASIPQVIVNQTRTFLGSPEIQEVQKNIASELDKIHDKFGDKFTETVNKLADSGVKNIINIIRQGLKKIEKIKPSDIEFGLTAVEIGASVYIGFSLLFGILLRYAAINILNILGSTGMAMETALDIATANAATDLEVAALLEAEEPALRAAILDINKRIIQFFLEKTGMEIAFLLNPPLFSMIAANLNAPAAAQIKKQITNICATLDNGLKDIENSYKKKRKIHEQKTTN